MINFVKYSKMRETVLGILGRQLHYSNTLDTDCTLYGLARAWTLSSDFKLSHSTPTSSTYTSLSTISQPTTPPLSSSTSTTVQSEPEPTTATEDFEMQPEVVLKSKREELLQRRKTQGANKESNKATTLSTLRKDLQKWSKDQQSRISQYYTIKRNRDREVVDKLMQVDSPEVPTLTLPSHVEPSSSTNTPTASDSNSSTSTNASSAPSHQQTTRGSGPSISVLS